MRAWGGRDVLLAFAAAAFVVAALAAVALLRPAPAPPPPRLDPIAAGLLGQHGVTVAAPYDPVLPAPVVTAERWGLPPLLAGAFTTYEPARPAHPAAPYFSLGPVNRPGGATSVSQDSHDLAYLGGSLARPGGRKLLAWIVVTREQRPDRVVEMVTLVDANSGHLLGRYAAPLTPAA